MAGVLFDTYDNWMLFEKFWLWPQKICQINRFGLSTPLATLLHVVHCIITLTNTFIPLLSYQYLSRLMTKPTKWHVCSAKIQISLGVRPVWSESSLSTWRKLGSSATIKHIAKTLIRLGECPGWSESLLGADAILLALSWDGSFSTPFILKCATKIWKIVSLIKF